MAIEIKIVTAIFNPDSATANAYGLWQWDYGQVLRIQGLHLPSMVEIHFSLQETGGTSVNRVGVTKDGVTDVIIPDSMLENDGADRTYDMFAFIYLTDATSGQTEYKIKLQVKSRPKPEVPGGGENPNIFHEAVQAVQKSADKAAESEKQAEGWAHGREDLPERAQDNAKYYAGQAAADAKKTGTDRKEVERLVESVSGIDEQVVKVENLTKQAQTSATNAALSEQAAKTAETNAQTAQAGAETAEGNAELAERNAKASEQAVEKAKQLVTQMGQEVLDNKNHVDQTAQAFTLTAQQAVADVNNAGQTQTEQVLSVGESAVESVKTAQDTATQAVEIAKTEAVKSVQTEGTTQTGNVTAEGTKQVQAVQQAAQEIVADREQIQQNKADVTALKEDLDDLVLKTKRNPLQLFNVNKVTDGRLKNDGTVDNNILYVTNRYEDISDFVGYYFASIGSDTPCAFYDEGGKLVQYFTDSRYYRNQIVPANSKYFKVSTAKSSANTFCFSVSNNKFNTVPTYNDYIVEKTELNPTVSVPTKQDRNVGADNKGKILMVGDDGNIVYKDYLEKENKIIEYWGDSLTEGNQDNSGVTRATVLSSLVGSEWTVINNNDGGGEKSNTISCKACGTGIIAEPFTIPSSTDKVEVVLKDDIGYDCNFRRSSNMAESTLNPCIINGITGIISPGLVYGQNPYKFQRNESGNEVVLKRPIGVISSSARKQKGSVLIICIGQNTGWNNDGSLLVKQVKGIIEYYKSTRFLVIGIPHSKMNGWQIAGNDALKLEFGRHYIDVEEYMKTPIYDADGTAIISSYALDDCNLTPTSEDIVNIGQNKYPTQIMSDSIHFNRYGYTIWANLEYQRGKELGYWN